jgi:hypothetical protein
MTNRHHTHFSIVETLVWDIDNDPVEDLDGALEIDIPIPQSGGPSRGVVGDLHDLT